MDLSFRSPDNIFDHQLTKSGVAFGDGQSRGVLIHVVLVFTLSCRCLDQLSRFGLSLLVPVNEVLAELLGLPFQVV